LSAVGSRSDDAHYADLRAVLETLDTKARDDLRRVLIRDQADRDAISSRLMRYRDENGQDWADIIDFLTMWPEARRRVARLLGERRGKVVQTWSGALSRGASV
jgi:hypothetical protein